MAITKQQALTESVFHENEPQRKDGSCYSHRRNGRTQVWKTRPDDFRVPVVYGLRGYGAITPSNASMFHTLADCHQYSEAPSMGEWDQALTASVEPRLAARAVSARQTDILTGGPACARMGP